MGIRRPCRERAFELARLAPLRGLVELRQQLTTEGYDSSHLNDRGLAIQVVYLSRKWMARARRGSIDMSRQSAPIRRVDDVIKTFQVLRWPLPHKPDVGQQDL
jgi:hypothetical protein